MIIGNKLYRDLKNIILGDIEFDNNKLCLLPRTPSARPEARWVVLGVVVEAHHALVADKVQCEDEHSVCLRTTFILCVSCEPTTTNLRSHLHQHS